MFRLLLIFLKVAAVVECSPSSVFIEDEFIRLRSQLFDCLSSLGITDLFTVEHPPAYTIEALMPYLSHLEGTAAKNLFLRDKKKRLYLLSARHDRKINLNDIGRMIGGAKDLRFADGDVLKEKLRVSPGFATAFGLMHDIDQSVQFVVDRALVDDATCVFFHPFVPTASTGIAFADMKKFLAKTGHDNYKIKTFDK
jgi:Ala-tRNA(Pro) deacylase